MSRALLVTLEYPPQVGGVAEYLRSLVGVADGGIEVMVPPLSRWLRPRWLPALAAVVRRVRGERPSALIVSHVLPVGEIAWLAKKLFGIPYAVILHGNDIGIVRGRGRFAQGRVRRILSCADLVAANSDATLSIALQFGATKDRSVVCRPTPSDAVREAAARGAEVRPATEAFSVLTVHRLVARKGAALLLSAFARLAEKCPEARLTVVGDGPERPRLNALAKELGVAEKVRFAGSLPVAELPALFASADVFAMTPRDPWPDVEGFGIVYLEAALFGKPSVASSVGGVPEAVLGGVTGLVVPPDDAEAIAAALTQLHDDAGLRARLGEAGRKRAREEFTPQRQMEPLLRWLSSL